MDDLPTPLSPRNTIFIFCLAELYELFLSISIINYPSIINAVINQFKAKLVLRMEVFYYWWWYDSLLNLTRSTASLFILLLLLLPPLLLVPSLQSHPVIRLALCISHHLHALFLDVLSVTDDFGCFCGWGLLSSSFSSIITSCTGSGLLVFLGTTAMEGGRITDPSSYSVGSWKALALISIFFS